MANSYNGWFASPNPRDLNITPLVFKGESFAPGVRGGDVHTVFTWLVYDLDNLIEPVYKAGWHTADDWGYSYRQNRNANNLSCHSSGTAIDYNATRHPNGKRGTFTAAQAKRIRELLRVNYRGLIRWGGDFTGTPDEMHFEIIGNAAQIARLVQDVLRFGGAGGRLPAGVPVPTAPPISSGGARAGDGILEKGDAGEAVKTLQRVLNAWYPDRKVGVDGDFGPATEALVKYFQGKAGLTADGVAGPKTLAALGLGYLK